MIHISEFASKLSQIPDAEFVHANVLNFLRENRVDACTLNPYLYFCQEKDHYTRNLIHRTDLFELIAICWDIGQKSPIHNHRDQSCWMAVPYGKLQVHNFALVKKDPGSGFCELRSSGQVLMDEANPQEVDVEEPIHQVLNLSSFNSKAISLHVYSRPFDTCEIYDLKEKKYWDTLLVNTSEYGVLKSDLPVVKIEL
jgi:cysteine dioxygenase